MDICSITISYLSYKKKRESDQFKKKNWLKEIETIKAMCNIDFDLLEEKKLKFEKLRRKILQSHIIRSLDKNTIDSNLEDFTQNVGVPKLDKITSKV